MMRDRRSGSGFKVFGSGIFLGVVLGLCLAIFSAWVVDKNSLRELFGDNPESTVAAPPAPDVPADIYSVPPEGSAGITQVPTPGTPPVNRPASAVVAVPDGKAPIVATTPTTPESPSAPPVAVTPPPQTASVSVPETKSTHWLQVGSFTKPEDAENRRVDLALLGWEATVQKTDIPNIGIRYRVRIGPFSDETILARIKTEVERRNFQTSVVQQ
ncbi:MAG: SPOR domain-containing protein [Burkholderiales bacterium]|jgi:cell division protein FtsN|nr:SPOR domain-containing protein [Burkholderiales bacterium]